MVLPDKRRLQYMSWLTLLGMSAIGILLITYVQQKDAQVLLLGGRRYYVQVAAGLFFGVVSGMLGLLLLRGKKFNAVRSFFEDLMQELNPSLLNILFYSFCAGLGEEILFRAGLQPIIGIWPASVIFVMLHGYINPSNIRLSIYGLFLVIICSGFGYLFKIFGLASAFSAHFVYDVAMFSALKYNYHGKGGGGRV